MSAAPEPAPVASPEVPETSGPARTRALEDDLRARGLPLVVRPAVRRRALVRRCGPMLWTLAWALVCVAVLDTCVDVLEPRLLETGGEVQLLSDDIQILGVAILTALAFVALWLSPLVLWFAVAVTRRLSRRTQQISAIIAIIVAIGLPALIEGAAGILGTLVICAACVLGILAASYAGLGTLLPWSALRVRRELWTLGPMVARVLPVLVIAFLFSFYNAEIWQIAMVLSTERTWWTVAVILLLTVILVAVTTRDEFGAAGISGELESEERAPTWAERINLRAVPIMVIGIQVLICSTLTFAFFVAFGVLSVPAGTIAQWIGRAPTPLLRSFPQLPVSLELARVSLVLAAFAGLNFAASAGSDARHREVFLRPVLDEVREGLQVRRVYLEHRR